MCHLCQVDFLREKGFLVVDHRETYIDEAVEAKSRRGWTGRVSIRDALCSDRVIFS